MFVEGRGGQWEADHTEGASFLFAFAASAGQPGDFSWQLASGQAGVVQEGMRPSSAGPS